MCRLIYCIRVIYSVRHSCNFILITLQSYLQILFCQNIFLKINFSQLYFLFVLGFCLAGSIMAMFVFERSGVAATLKPKGDFLLSPLIFCNIMLKLHAPVLLYSAADSEIMPLNYIRLCCGVCSRISIVIMMNYSIIYRIPAFFK